jgi:hypothetical protein
VKIWRRHINIFLDKKVKKREHFGDQDVAKRIILEPILNK